MLIISDSDGNFSPGANSLLRMRWRKSDSMRLNREGVGVLICVINADCFDDIY
jgi:hypothetical protein